jgi:hypothetical protein
LGSPSLGGMTVSGRAVSGLTLIAASDGFTVITTVGDVLVGKAGSETITSNAGIFTLSGPISGQTLTFGPNTHTLKGTVANLNLVTLTNLSFNDQIVVTGVRFGALRYDSSSGVLQLDTGGDGSFATRINLLSGLGDDFLATASALSDSAYTTVLLSAVPESSAWLTMLTVRTRRSRS